MNLMREAISRSALTQVAPTADGGEQRFCFAADFSGFAGHFPGYPILPAILQVLLAQMVAEELTGKPLQLAALERAKFTRQIRPDETVTVRVNCMSNDEHLRCNAQLTVGDETAALFVLKAFC